MGNWAHKCLFALQFGICIHSDGFFHVQMRGTQVRNGCPQGRRVPLKTQPSFPSPAKTGRRARKIGREWTRCHLDSSGNVPREHSSFIAPPPHTHPRKAEGQPSELWLLLFETITKDLRKVSKNQVTNINTRAVTYVGSFDILTVFGIFWRWPYEGTQCHPVLLRWFWGGSFCLAVKLTHTHVHRNIWEHKLLFFFLKLTKRRQKIIMDLHQEGVQFWDDSHVLAHSLVGLSLLSILDTLSAAESCLLMCWGAQDRKWGSLNVSSVGVCALLCQPHTLS